MPAKPKIHLTALASGLASETQRLGLKTPAALVKLVQQHIGTRYRVTGTPNILEATQDPHKGGRRDDPQRARELQDIFQDENTRALIAIRGGAWFTRVIPRIDFKVLARRKSPLYIFGFSEMTTLVNLASAYPSVVAVHDLCPGFVFGGMARHAKRNIDALSAGITLPADGHHAFAAGWAAAQFKDKFLSFFDDVVEMIEGRPSAREWTGRVVSGTMANRKEISVVGGNLSLLSALLGAQDHPLDISGNWLALEDLNEDTENIDRMLAGMKLAGWLDEPAGLIVGDFHTEKEVLTEAVIALLKNLIPRNKPIIHLNEFGHIWPLSPLPIRRPITLHRRGKTALTLSIPWDTYAKR